MKDQLIRVGRWSVFIAAGLMMIGYLASGLRQNPAVPLSIDSELRPVSKGGEGSADRLATTSDVADKPSAAASDLQTGTRPSQLSTDAVVSRVVADLDAEFERAWQRQGLEVAPKADWLTICRRMSMALVGSGLSLEEIRYLQSLPEDQRVATHRERLLSDKRFADYWAERLARTVVGAEEGPFIVYRRRRFITWLSEQIAGNRPYDAIVRQLITAEGYFTDRPEVNFVTVTMDSGESGQPDPIRLAGRTTRAFLAMRIDCLQCHDDFLGNLELGPATDPRGGTQQDFHRLAAFYSEARFNPLQGIRTEDHPYKYTYLNEAEETTVEAAVPFAADLLPAEGDLTERLATWVTHPKNRQSARAISNRVWALMFGQPLHAPVDDIPLHGPLPPGLDRLADGVLETGWDLRQLIRIVTSTRAFQLDSRAPFEVTLEHETAWAVFPLIRLRPEQVARAIVQASRLTTIDDSAAFVLQLLAFGNENDFVKRYGDTGEDEFDQENVTITQRLLMMNGNLVRERTEQNPVLNASSHINMFAPDDPTVVETVYLAVLNRQPTETQLAHFVQRIDQADNRQQAIEDLYWVLLNSSEMAWNH